MPGKLKAVLAGCGGISNAWLGPISKIHGLEIAGLVDINEDAATKRKEEHGLDWAESGTDLKTMLRAVKPDIVFDCTPPDARGSIVVKALNYGCHVLCEKPLADSMTNARRILQAARKAGTVCAVIQNHRYDHRVRAFREFIGSGKIGKLNTLHCDFFIEAHFDGFRSHMKHVLLLDMAIHTFDAARFISGADPVAVYCKEWNPAGSWYDHDASAVAIFEMTGGIVYTYRGSWCSEGMNTAWQSQWRAIAVKGSAVWDGAKSLRAQRVKQKGEQEFSHELEDLEIKVADTGKPEGHGGLITDFVECVRSGRKPETTCDDNIKSLAMVFGAVESAKAGRKIDVKNV